MLVKSKENYLENEKKYRKYIENEDDNSDLHAMRIWLKIRCQNIHSKNLLKSLKFSAALTSEGN